jgi:single-strand DNA-binding protein
MDLNKATLIGNITRDPEMRTTPAGASVASFSIATNFTWKDQAGQMQKRAEFHNIVAWRKLAEICGQYLKKGAKVYIEGRLQTRDWVGQDSVKRYRTEIVADNMIMLDRVNSGATNQSNNYQNQQTPQNNEPVINVEEDPIDNQPPVENNEEEIKVENIPF